MKESAKRYFLLFDALKDLGVELTYGVSKSDRLAFYTIEVSFSSSIVQYIVTLLLRELCKSTNGISIISRDSLYIYFF